MFSALLLATAAPVLLSGFDNADAWKAAASDGVKSQVESVDGADGHALKLDYDFGDVSGYAYLTRKLPIDWPDNYEMRFKVRGQGGVNDLQIKFTDASGENVWWTQRLNFRPSQEWQEITIRPRDMSFAWGPIADKTLRHTQNMEITLVRGRDGGSGSIEIDGLSFTKLDPPKPLPAPVASDAAVFDNDPATAWRGRGGQSLTVDFGGVKELGGVVLDWAEGHSAKAYAIEASNDGSEWTMLRQVTQGDGGSDPVPLPGTQTRFLRIALDPSVRKARLTNLAIKPLSWGETPNAMVEDLAKTAPKGIYPRGFTEQSYWTLTGSDGGKIAALIGEDGAIEPDKGSFSVEPFVTVDGRTFNWADVQSTPSLEEGYLPIPHVTWTGKDWSLDTMAFATASDKPQLLSRWRLTNNGTTKRHFRLVLAVRPFQVNPPAQFLSQQGGVSEISQLHWDGKQLAVTTPSPIHGDAATQRSLHPLVTPDHVGMRSFDQGALGDPASAPDATSLNDPAKLGSATLTWDVTLAPGAHMDVPMAFAQDGTTAIAESAFEPALKAARASWKAKLNTVSLKVPPQKQALADTLRTALAHILISRNGAQLKPGTRSYNRSWIRDGAMMSDSLLRLGVTQPAIDFANWYSTKLFKNGKVPCCVDYRGADPVPENDSDGEYIHLITQIYRFTGDKDWLASEWPNINVVRNHMDGLRQSERTPKNQTPDRLMLYGLMPPSISHEGYSEKIQYSLWDDFWTLAGYKSAAYAAQVLDRPETKAIEGERDQFTNDLKAAITASAKYWKIDYIPGATSLGDFDATSTTMAFDPAGIAPELDQTLLHNTFVKQWNRVMSRPGSTDWEDYTPYELRNVSAMVRLGWTEQANAMLDFYMKDRRPEAWNQWAEVVGRDPREIRFIGDMPHAWVESDFIRAALDMFAYVRFTDETLVVGGGLTPEWLSGDGVSMKGLQTR